MGSKDREGPKPGYCQVFPQSAVGFWVMALEAEGDKVRGTMEQAGIQHRLGE